MVAGMKSTVVAAIVTAVSVVFLLHFFSSNRDAELNGLKSRVNLLQDMMSRERLAPKAAEPTPEPTACVNLRQDMMSRVAPKAAEPTACPEVPPPGSVFQAVSDKNVLVKFPVQAENKVDVFVGVPVRGTPHNIAVMFRTEHCGDYVRTHKEDYLLHDRPMHKSHFRDGGYVVDIGACYGDTPLVYGTEAEKTIAFEPNPYTFPVLEVNAKLNPFLNIEPHNVGIADVAGTWTWRSGGAGFCNGEIVKAGHGHWDVTPEDLQKAKDENRAIDVTAVEFLSYMKSKYSSEELQKIKLIKIDTEGNDKTVLRTLKGFLDSLPAKPLIECEWFDYFNKGGPEDTDPNSKELFDAIEYIGYEPFDPSQFEMKPVGHTSGSARVYTTSWTGKSQNRHKLPDLMLMPKRI